MNSNQSNLSKALRTSLITAISLAFAGANQASASVVETFNYELLAPGRGEQPRPNDVKLQLIEFGNTLDHVTDTVGDARGQIIAMGETEGGYIDVSMGKIGETDIKDMVRIGLIAAEAGQEILALIGTEGLTLGAYDEIESMMTDIDMAKNQFLTNVELAIEGKITLDQATTAQLETAMNKAHAKMIAIQALTRHADNMSATELAKGAGDKTATGDTGIKTDTATIGKTTVAAT